MKNIPKLVDMQNSYLESVDIQKIAIHLKLFCINS